MQYQNQTEDGSLISCVLTQVTPVSSQCKHASQLSQQLAAKQTPLATTAAATAHTALDCSIHSLICQTAPHLRFCNPMQAHAACGPRQDDSHAWLSQVHACLAITAHHSISGPTSIPRPSCTACHVLTHHSCGARCSCCIFGFWVSCKLGCEGLGHFGSHHHLGAQRVRRLPQHLGVVLPHHDAELLVVNGAVPVPVHRADDGLHLLGVRALTHLLQSHNDFLLGDEARVVLVKVLESLHHVLLAVELGQVHGGRQELLVVDAAVAVDVDLVHDGLHLGLVQLGALLAQPLAQLVHADSAAAVLVDRLKHGPQPGQLRPRQPARNHLECLLLQLVHLCELPHTSEHLRDERVSRHAVVAHPGVLQHLLRRQPLARVAREHLAHAVLGCVADAWPGVGLEVQGL
mmetsp:Transcript_17101/g.42888  ORF Transcript_17101/g.42888 Transcript_17101/m.42888 type:complete len:403 (-) Transcript_17101:948-2156(-)